MWSVVGGLTTVIWSVVGFFTATGRWFFRSVVDGSFGRWSVIFQVSGRWSVVGGACSVVGVTVVGGRCLWSVVGGFVLRRIITRLVWIL